MIFLLIVLLSFLPSIAWLIFFLKEDAKPEPKKTIFKVFIYGIISTIPVIFIVYYITNFLILAGIDLSTARFIQIVFLSAIFEELTKFLVIKFVILNNSECDELIDIMIYSITVAMGFAALENLLFIFPINEFMIFLSNPQSTETLISFKGIGLGLITGFLSGTFLHVLMSGLIGYFIAISMFNKKRKFFITIKGLILVMALHGLYNFSIISSGVIRFLAPAILITTFIVIFLCFKKLREITNIYKNECTKRKQ